MTVLFAIFATRGKDPEGGKLSLRRGAAFDATPPGRYSCTGSAAPAELPACACPDCRGVLPCGRGVQIFCQNRAFNVVFRPSLPAKLEIREYFLHISLIIF